MSDTSGVAAPDGGPWSATTRSPIVIRKALLARLMRTGEAPRVAVLAAPAGSGKSTLLAQWSDADTRPVARLHLAPVHADPVQLVEAVAEAVAACLPDGPVARMLPAMHTADALRNQSRLSAAIAAEPRSALLILEDVHRLRGRVAALDTVISLVDRLPLGWTVAVSQRGSVALPTARWRLAGALVHIGYENLVLDAAECRAVLSGVGVEVTEPLVAEVLERTEGWPAGVYLAGLSLRTKRRLPTGTLLAGDDTLVRSYLDAEILAEIDPADRELLVQTSFLDEISGPLAEAVTGDALAGERLHRIASQNLLVTVVDARQQWFRCHSLLRERLHRDLEDGKRRRAPLHARASAWFEANGRLQDAVHHAFAGDEPERPLRLVVDALQQQYRSGHVDTYRSWLDRFPAEAFRENPQLALSAAWLAAVEGDTDGCARWSALARLESVDHADPDPSDNALDPWLIRSMMVIDGPEQALADAQRSLALHDGAWRWHGTALAAVGAAQLMLGDHAGTMAAFDSMERSPGIGHAAVRLVARAERAVDAMARHAWSEAESILAPDRRRILDDPDGGRLVGTIWLCADARLSLHRGDVRGAQDRLRRAQLGRLRLTWAIPWLAVRGLTLMAQTHLLVGDPGGAKASLAQAREVVRMRPRLGRLVADIDQVAVRIRHGSVGGSGPSTLSPAELRLLPFLQTYLSFKEIGERLGISGNTVKTEAMSIYAKLGATSRSEAMEKAVESGLLEDPFI